MKILYLFFLVVPLLWTASPQDEEELELYGIGTLWDDSYKAWIIYSNDEEVEGELELRWIAQWDAWDYSLGDKSGEIKQKWHNDPSQWELRGDNKIVTMKAKWQGDLSEWRISDGTQSLTLSSRYLTHLEEWLVEDKTHGKFEMYTTYQQDPRDWEVVDGLGEDISFEMRMALVFVVMYVSTPKL